MRLRQIFPGLTDYQLTAEDEASLNSDFKLVFHNANLVDPDKGDIGSLRTVSPIGPGVYFWTMSLASVTYKIYIGKTKSLKRRVSDYIKGFQPHSPNDYKLRIFQQVVVGHDPTTVFQLHFVSADLMSYTKLETEAVRRYRPLLNESTRVSVQTKEALRTSFEAFYWRGVEERLNKDE